MMLPYEGCEDWTIVGIGVVWKLKSWLEACRNLKEQYIFWKGRNFHQHGNWTYDIWPGSIWKSYPRRAWRCVRENQNHDAGIRRMWESKLWLWDWKDLGVLMNTKFLRRYKFSSTQEPSSRCLDWNYVGVKCITQSSCYWDGKQTEMEPMMLALEEAWESNRRRWNVRNAEIKAMMLGLEVCGNPSQHDWRYMDCKPWWWDWKNVFSAWGVHESNLTLGLDSHRNERQIIGIWSISKVMSFQNVFSSMWDSKLTGASSWDSWSSLKELTVKKRM